MTEVTETQVLEVQYNEEQLKIIGDCRRVFVDQIKTIEHEVTQAEVDEEQSVDDAIAERVQQAMASVIDLLDSDYILVPKEEDLMVLPASTEVFVQTNATVPYMVGLDISGGLAKMYAEINS